MGSVSGVIYEILFNCPLSAATTGSEIGTTLSGAGLPIGEHHHRGGCEG